MPNRHTGDVVQQAHDSMMDVVNNRDKKIGDLRSALYRIRRTLRTDDTLRAAQAADLIARDALGEE